ncbi:MAG: DUF1156 domain-containing protein [Chloroflexota bacterium]
MTQLYPKRLIEVDLPIKRISAHARREKSIRHGHISTLHIWWARRPLAACRAVLCAALWPDPADELCPPSFREAAARLMQAFAFTAAQERSVADLCDPITWGYLSALRQPEGALAPDKPNHMSVLRTVLLQFIADFANWDASTEPHYLATARALTQAAHQALGGQPGTRPLVVDPFAGGGAIPLEALRVGADAFASDLNPVAVLLNKVVLEYIPRYGQRLADEVRKWGKWVEREAKKELAGFYPKDPDGAMPIAYLWARTITCEGPGCGAEIPLVKDLWLAKKRNRTIALRLVPLPSEKRASFEIIEHAIPKQVGVGTIRGGSVTCPLCGYTTPVTSVRKQLSQRRGGAADARLLSVVTIRPGQQGRFYRLCNDRDLDIVRRAETKLERRKQEHKEELSLVPDEPLPPQGALGFRIQLYGMERWIDIYTARQALALSTLARLVRAAGREVVTRHGEDLGKAVQAVLALVLDKLVDVGGTSLNYWKVDAECPVNVFVRQAIPMMWDFAEAVPISEASGSWVSQCGRQCRALDAATFDYLPGQVAKSSATNQILPNDASNCFFTDPPYYDAVPYSDLSDFFYVWLKRTLGELYPEVFVDYVSPKNDECIVDRVRGKDKLFFETTMGLAMAEGRRILAPNGIGVVVFAHKSTSGWEAQLQAMINAGWVITSSWPIDTEQAHRMRARDSAALASSIHLVCRPRENPDGSLRTDAVGEWRDVLGELPTRIHTWMPRLAREGIVGADAIFACLGPALEIYSRYSRVERADGTPVPLGDVLDERGNVVERGYLSHVWEAVSHEALSMIFEQADTAGFEADARLTAMWLWTLSTADGTETGSNGKVVKSQGYSLEYDAARKIAQGLGAHLDQLGNLVEIKGDQARLLPVAERTQALFGKDGTLSASKGGVSAPRGRKPASAQMSLFEVETEEGIAAIGDLGAPPHGTTVLDRVHQAMLLFASGRSEALRRFLAEEGIGREARFWTLAQALSALYPASTDEKRWVDGVLARKKGLGF